MEQRERVKKGSRKTILLYRPAGGGDVYDEWDEDQENRPLFPSCVKGSPLGPPPPRSNPPRCLLQRPRELGTSSSGRKCPVQVDTPEHSRRQLALSCEVRPSWSPSLRSGRATGTPSMYGQWDCNVKLA